MTARRTRPGLCWEATIGNLGNLGDILEAIQSAVADEAPAFIHGDRVISWPDAFRRMSALARGLRDAGLRPGDKVAFYLRNGPEYGELAGACFLGRFTHANVNYRYKPDEVRYILENADAAAVVFDRDFRDTIMAIAPRLPALKVRVEVGGSSARASAILDYEALAATPAGAAFGPRSADDEVFIYTGGTTGLPKGVIYRQGDLGPYLLASSGLFTEGPPAGIDDVIEMIRARGGAGGRYMPVCPQMHGTGLFVTLWTMITGGCVVTVDSPFDAEAVWAAVAAAKVDSLAIVGDAFARPMLRVLDAAPTRFDLSSVMAMGSSGAMWSAEVKQGLLNHLPWALMADVYASSEATGLGLSVTTKDGHTSTAAFTPGADLILIDELDQPIALVPGARGRVAVGGVQPLGYYKDPEKTAKTFKVIDGVRYAIPGDHAAIGEAGELILLGRGSGCINTAGEKVFPEEVEEALKTHPDVEDALVVGAPDLAWGQAVTAVVMLAAGATLDEAALRDHVRERLASYKSPKRVFLAEGNLRAPNGKADYPAATAQVKAALAQ